MSRQKDVHVPSVQDFPQTVARSLLFVVIDLHPLSWSLLGGPPPPAIPNEYENPAINKAPTTSLPITDFIDILTVFLNAHMASRWGNDVVVYGASAGRSYVMNWHGVYD